MSNEFLNRSSDAIFFLFVYLKKAIAAKSLGKSSDCSEKSFDDDRRNDTDRKSRCELHIGTDVACFHLSIFLADRSSVSSNLNLVLIFSNSAPCFE